MIRSLALLFILSQMFFSLEAEAQVRLPRIIRDSMVLQRDAKLNIWGWASPKEKITVRFNNKNFKTTTTADGKWQIQLPPMKAGGPYTMEITASNKILLKEILLGDVWFCSGQSNMVHQLNIHDVTYENEINAANDDKIRLFLVPTLTNLQAPQSDVPNGHWRSAVGEEVRNFSAVAYFFAKKLYDTYKVPIGLINASVGGTPIEAWTSAEGLQAFPDIQKTIEQNKDTAYVNKTNREAGASTIQPPVNDKGMTGNTKWYDPAFVPENWRNIHIPGYWEDQGIKDLNGIVWYRKEIDIPSSMTGKAGRIFLGRIVDADELYINGKLIGQSTYQYPQRRYAVPQDVLKPGKNLFVIRVTNTAGKGGFVPDKSYYIFSGKDTVQLHGDWQYKVGAVFPPSPPPLPSVSFPHQPSALFNAMAAPFTNYTVKAILWYQGETNAGRPDAYRKLLPALINDWRHQWKKEDLPFLYVQLPGFMDYNYLPAESNWAKTREAQLKALSLPNTAMAVTIDLGEWNDVHPEKKKEVGERLALAAEKLAYGKDIVYSGPIFRSAAVEGEQIIIQFDHAASGLITNDHEAPSEFAIAGADKKFVWANAVIHGDKVIVSSPAVKTPLYVRYAWADNPVNPNLYNREGLPASPFRTDQ
jgi:sialate O-acetylesterase